METCKSPRKVMRAAYALALDTLPDFSCKFSRKDFTLPQLFACLAVREHQKKSYRGAEALLADSPHWLADCGMSKAPDHNTLCRAFGVIVTLRRTNRMLDVTAESFADADLLDWDQKPLAGDSTHFESRHVSRHFEKRQEQTAKADEKKAAAVAVAAGADAEKQPEKGGKKPAAARVDKGNSATRSKTVKSLPKASFAVAAACHGILAVVVGTGAGSDAPAFEPLLLQACRRAPGVKVVVTDPGFDSEDNHRIARLDMGVRSIIPPAIGRPSKDGSPPGGYFRRLMHHRFKCKADKRWYGQRWQVETVNSMIKRNLGSALRARTAKRREMEMLLRAVVHNVMLLAA
jgi:hypothetical protein